MEDFYSNNPSQEGSHSNITSNYYDYSSMSEYDYNNFTIDHDYRSAAHIMHVVTCIIISIGLPLTLVAIYALYNQVRNDHVAPIYVINLLISDLIQFCCMIAEVVRPEDWKISVIFNYIYNFAVFSSVGFMVCVALERYLVIACPLWYHFRRTIKISVVVCVLVWIHPLIFLLLNYFWVDFEVIKATFAVFLLLPFPLLIFSLGGTLKALSASRVPSDEKRRIVGTLVLVLLIYTLLFLPTIIWFLAEDANYTFTNLSLMFVRLSPLADLVLYVFMRKGAIDKLLASVCCCRMDSDEMSSSTG